MNEIEKLYKNAGIKKINTHQSEIDNGDPRFTGISHSDSYIKYPPLTADKQIKLIKWLIQKDFYDERIIRSNFEQTYFYCSYIDDYGDYRESEYFEKFEEALANVFNYFWQSLAPKEKQQIREILE